MNSEKVKEIKTALECCGKNNPDCDNCPYSVGGGSLCRQPEQEALTLINELESENERLSKERDKYIIENKDIEESNTYANKFLENYKEENQKLKDRIAELEEYIKGNEQDAKAFVNGWHKDLETELKQFAERLKDHPTMKIYSLHNACERIPKAIDETLKEFLNK